MKKLFQLMIIIGFGLTLNSCYYDSIYEPQDIGDGGGDVTEEITYDTDIAPIFGFCSNCHNGSQVPDLREGNAYNALVPDYVTPFDAAASPLYIQLEGGHQNLPASRLSLVEEWINQGALE